MTRLRRDAFTAERARRLRYAPCESRRFIAVFTTRPPDGASDGANDGGICGTASARRKACTSAPEPTSILASPVPLPEPGAREGAALRHRSALRAKTFALTKFGRPPRRLASRRSMPKSLSISRQSRSNAMPSPVASKFDAKRNSVAELSCSGVSSPRIANGSVGSRLCSAAWALLSGARLAAFKSRDFGTSTQRSAKSMTAG